MYSYSLPCCYFPTTVLLVDDQQKFLNALKLRLNKQHAIYRCFGRPEEALAFLQTCKISPFDERYLNNSKEAESDCPRMGPDIRAIKNEAFNPKRFDEISVIVVDYDMPGCNGLKFCEQVNNPYIKKILLTGVADAEIAKNAFNKGLIDQFIRKDELSDFSVLDTAIRSLQKKYFTELSNVIIRTMMNEQEGYPCHLNDPEFVKVFNELFEKNDICEYYLLDATGSFFFLNKEGKPSWLAVKSEEELNSLYELASLYIKDVVPNEVLSALKNKSRILFSFSDVDLDRAPDMWLPHLHEAIAVEGIKQSKFYYSFITDNEIYKFDHTNFLSYRTYLSQNKANQK